MKAAIFLAALALSALPAHAADITGTWVFTTPVTPTCTLTQSGTSLNGSCKGPQATGIVTGTVTGNTVKFIWSRTNSAGGAMPAIEFTGIVNATRMAGLATTGQQSAAFAATTQETAAQATALPPPPERGLLRNAAAPKSIWQLNGTTAVHLQSGLECPLSVGDHLRRDYTAVDPYGFSVRCTYYNAPFRSVISIALSVGNTPAEFEQAKSGLLKSQGMALRADTLPLQSSRTWTKGGFATNNADPFTDIFASDIGKWSAALIAIYPKENANHTSGDLAALAALLERTAVPPLTACAPAQTLATRAGTRLTMQKPENESRLTALENSGAVLARDVILGSANSPAPIWCANVGFYNSRGQYFVSWMNIAPHASTGGAVERITRVAGGDMVYVLADGTARHVVLENENTLSLRGIYEGHPSLNEIDDLVLLTVRPGIYATVNKADRKITVYKPF